VGTHYKGSPAEVRALDALIKLVRATAAVEAGLGPGVRDEGLTPGQFGLLEALLHLGPLEPCELGPRLLTSRPNVVLLVDQLEGHGLVRRVPVPGDRRRVRIQLTPAGTRIVRSAFARHVRKVVETFAALSAAEQEQLAALCKRVGLAAAERTARMRTRHDGHHAPEAP
jgi:MarR family 2-MHQ and catechol resistance regulon transcriptional repressor